MNSSTPLVIILIISLLIFRATAFEVYKPKIIKKIPHQGFTQGLLYHEGHLYESTGLYNQSELKKINANTGEVIKKIKILDIFAEGLALANKNLYQLSWRRGLLKIYNHNFELIEEKKYWGEGWGLTSSEFHFFMSDGSKYLQVRNKSNFELIKKIEVGWVEKVEKAKINFMGKINELEYVGGKIYANVWFKNYLIIFDLKEENLIGMVDCHELANKEKKAMQKKGQWQENNVLNGIAHDPLSNHFFLTGKNWSWIYRVIFFEVKRNSDFVSI